METAHRHDRTCLKKCPSIVSRKIHNAFFLIDITDNYAQDTCALYEINETGNFIWQQIDGQKTVRDIAQALQQAIVDEVDLQILVDDVAEFVDTLIGKGFVEV